MGRHVGRIQAASTQEGGLGFANPSIYAVANDGTKYAKDFFDVGGLSADTIPSCNGVTPLNCSHPGWDYLNGWGTPNVTELMKDLDGGSHDAGQDDDACNSCRRCRPTRTVARRAPVQGDRPGR